MSFVFPFSHHRALDDPASRIDRTLDDRHYRLIAGLSVSDRFDRVDASLLVAVGHGKYLRVRHLEVASQTLPGSLTKSLLEVAAQGQPATAQIKQLSTDLALLQASLFEQIKCRAGKYVDRVLAIAVTDPGLWWTDFDGSRQHHGLCDAVRLSELTGVTVIDDFPGRDIAVGGTGRSLDALPTWLLAADRDSRIAVDHRLVLTFDDHAAGYWLPASDGLDAETPKIRSLAPVPGIRFLNALVERFASHVLSDAELERSYAQGTRLPSLIDGWNRGWQDAKQQVAAENSASSTLSALSSHYAALVSLTDRYATADNLPDLLRSAIYWIVQLLLQQVDPIETRADQVLFAAETPLAHCLTNQLIQASKLRDTDVQSLAKFHPDLDNRSSQVITAAILGLLHIDQLPANLPFVTGATEQRILGRLSPGKPMQWRHLVREMADFHPPAMKLRDAV